MVNKDECFKRVEPMQYEELLRWFKNYDSMKYPIGIYNELVVEGKEQSDKFALM